MAMITCPQCGKELSDKALKCVQCGYEFERIVPKRICTECGTELNEDETVCHNCGAPIEEAKSIEQTPQQVEVTRVRFGKINKKFIVIGIVAIVAVIAIILGVQHVQKVNAEKEAEELRATYESNLQLATMTMLSGAADAETCGNLIKQVWYNAIYEERDSATDEYTRPDGYFVSDFNEALSNLFMDSSFDDDISSIEQNQETVQSLMKELKNPPEGYEDAYEAISDLYSAYTGFTNLVTNPTGSLQTFSQNFNDADSNTMNCYNAMDLYLD